MRSDQPTKKVGRRGSDGTKGLAEPRFIAIGHIGRPHGVRGEVVVKVLTDFPERFDTIQAVYLGDAHQAELWHVAATRWKGDRVLMAFRGCEDRTGAEELCGLMVQVPIEEAIPLAEDEYYPHELMGLDVMTVDGEDLGRISDILFTKANDVYVVTGPRGQILLPAIADVIYRVDLETGQVVVKLMEGLE